MPAIAAADRLLLFVLSSLAVMRPVIVLIVSADVTESASVATADTCVVHAVTVLSSKPAIVGSVASCGTDQSVFGVGQLGGLLLGV